jgi:hypothetical protein
VGGAGARGSLAGLIETLDRSGAAWLRSASEAGLILDVDFDVVSLYRGAHAAVEEREGMVAVRYQLHPQHPQVAPAAVALTRHLFNVHIADPENCASHLPPIPLICLGPFLPQMRVSDWVVATYDLLRWARISTERPLNPSLLAQGRPAGRRGKAGAAGLGRRPGDGAGACGDGLGGAAAGLGVEGDVKARIERRSQGCLIRAPAQVAWRDVVAGTRLDVLTRDYVYNARPVCAGAALEVWAALPPLAEVERRRRKWLVAKVERAARALGEPSPGGGPGASGPPQAPAGAANDTSAGAALDAVRWVTEGKGWLTSACADGALEIVSGGLAEPAFTARAEGRGARVELPVRFLAPSGASACLRRAALHAVLLLNARAVFARLRVVAADPLVLRVEHQLPAEQLFEDEIEHALEGMRYAAREAARTFETLRHPAVSQEYAEAHELAL